MAKCNPKAFWKKIKKYSSCNKVGSETLSSNDFFQHFSGVLEGDGNQNDRHLNLDFDLQSNEYLDSEISQEEVTAAIRSLTSNKSPGMDGLIPEIFKASADTITPFVTVLFNTYSYPKSWTESYITPNFKKGDADDTNNYFDQHFSQIVF